MARSGSSRLDQSSADKRLTAKARRGCERAVLCAACSLLQSNPWAFGRQRPKSAISQEVHDEGQDDLIRKGRSAARRSRRDVIGKKFQGDEAAERGVLAFVDNAHPATAELFENAVMRDCRPITGGCALFQSRFILRRGQPAGQRNASAGNKAWLSADREGGCRLTAISKRTSASGNYLTGARTRKHCSRRVRHSCVGEAPEPEPVSLAVSSATLTLAD